MNESLNAVRRLDQLTLLRIVCVMAENDGETSVKRWKSVKEFLKKSCSLLTDLHVL